MAMVFSAGTPSLWTTAVRFKHSRIVVAMASPRRGKGSSNNSIKTGARQRPQQQKNRRQQRIRVEEFNPDDDDEDDEFDDFNEDDEAGLEALFAQLEKDLEADRAGKKVDVESVTEDQIAALEQELMGTKNSKKNVKKSKTKTKTEIEDDGDGDGDEQEQANRGSNLATFIEEAQRLESETVAKRIVQLEKWQLRKLRAALDLDKSQLKVKALAGETGLDRRDVLTFLRDPPPELIELIDAVSDAETDGEEDEEDDGDDQEEKTSSGEVVAAEESKEAKQVSRVERIGLPGDVQGSGPKSWYGKKRIRKEHLETFEKVFQRTRRPTGALIQNIVELTHVPRKRVLDWFETRRGEYAARKNSKDK